MAAPQFRVLNFDAPDRYYGATSGAMPCSPGDTITFTASIRYVSGGMQPLIGVFFYDALLETNYGYIQISPPNTDSGWHNYTFTVQVPSPAVMMVVETFCEYLTVGGEVNTQTTAPIYPGSAVAVPVASTSGMIVGQTLSLSNKPDRKYEDVVVLGVDSGVSFTADITTFFPSGAAVVNAFPPETCYFVGFVGSGYEPSFSSASPTVWEVSDFRITQNGNPVYSPLAFFSPSLTSYQQLFEFIYPLYYLSLITSEYKNAPNFYAWLATLLTAPTDLIACVQQAYVNFNLNTPPVGPQLDIIGGIVGISRQLSFQPGVSTTTSSAVTGTGSQTVDVTPFAMGTSTGTSGMAVGGGLAIGGASPETVTITAYVPGTSFTAVFTHTHLSGVSVTSTPAESSTLGDADYLTLIKAKIAQNQWNGQIDSIYALLNALYPNSGILLIDNANMTVTVVLTGGVLTPLQEQMVLNGLILPRPQGVLYTFEYAALPLFGFDLNTAFVAGFDTGNFV
jgi:hypothetical protein